MGEFGAALLRANPGLTLSIHSDTSREIERGLHANQFDAGLTYLDHEPPANMLAVALHDEDYLAVVPADHPLAGAGAVTWQQLAAQPLCLLHQGMQFRRILDRQFADRDLSVTPAAIADSYVSLLALVRAGGGLATVIPAAYAELMAGMAWGRFLSLAPPAAPRRVGLVVVDRAPLGSMARAGFNAARQLELAPHPNPR